MDAVITELLQLEPGGGTYKNRFTVVTDFGRLLYVVGGVYGVSTPAQQSTFFRSEDEPPHEPYGFHYMMLLLLRTGRVVTDMNATVGMAGYDYLTINLISSFRHTSPTAILSAFMTGMCVFHQDMLVSQDGEHVTDQAMTEANDMNDVNRVVQLRAQRAMVSELSTVIAEATGVGEETLNARRHIDMLTTEAAVTAAQMRSTTQASIQGFEVLRRGRDETMRRDRPTFLEQQLPPWDNVGTVQPLLIGTTTEERSARYEPMNRLLHPRATRQPVPLRQPHRCGH